MTLWPSSKAKQVLSALYRIGWTLKRQSGSHKTLSRPGFPDVVFAFHDGEEIGPRMFARIAKRTGLTPDDNDCHALPPGTRGAVVDLRVKEMVVHGPFWFHHSLLFPL